MNDPEVIAWLESPEGDKWRWKNLVQTPLLTVLLKEDLEDDGVFPVKPWQWAVQREGSLEWQWSSL